jgi:hypothetical protein
MTKLALCIGAGFFLGCATASPSSQSVQSTSTAQAPLQQDGAKVATAKKKKNPKEGLICETYKVTGSHLRKEICRTKEQMERDREQADKLIREADRARPAEGT